MLEALTHAQETGFLRIPCENPAYLRLRFYGLLKALRKEGKTELADGLIFRIPKNTPELVIEATGATPLDATITAAIKAAGREIPQTSPSFDAEAALERILNGAKAP